MKSFFLRDTMILLARKGKEMYKLLLLDIDGTLRDERSGIPDSAKKAISLAQFRGCKVILCTGRSMGIISDDVLALNVDGCIAGGGCHITLGEQVLFDSAFEDDLIQRVLGLLKKEGAAFALESCQKVFMNEGAKIILNGMNKKKAESLKNTEKQFVQEKIVYRDNINEFQHEPVHKICLWSSKSIFSKVKGILGESMEIAQAEDDYYEIIQIGCDKGDAVKKLQSYLKISKKNTICFGDGQNDIEMFLASGTGIAMKNSHPELKDRAACVCEDVWDHGIFNELKRRKII